MTLGFGCRCSRERVEALLRSMPENTLDELKRPNGQVDVTCQFCNQEYVFDAAELRALRGATTH
jgi:molecular chaperone Hsp33